MINLLEEFRLPWRSGALLDFSSGFPLEFFDVPLLDVSFFCVALFVETKVLAESAVRWGNRTFHWF